MTISLSVRRFGAFFALAVLGACGLPEPSASPLSSGYRADVPLVARIQTTSMRSTDGLRFYLNRPAHVALFEVVPGRGIGLLYPAQSFGSRTLSSGVHQARTYNTFFRASYLPATGMYAGAQPRYILLIASERPLRLDEIQRSPYGLRSVVGMQHFASFNPYSAMEALTESVLPVMAGDDWTSDVYVEWPDAPLSRPMMQLVRVQCPSGRVLTVPFEQAAYATRACDGRPQAKFIPPPTSGDSTVVRPPRRTRPVAEDNAGAPQRDGGRQNVRGTDAPRVARPRPEQSEPRARGSAPREVPAQRAEPRAEPRPAPRAEPQSESRTEPRQPRVERPTPREQR